MSCQKCRLFPSLQSSLPLRSDTIAFRRWTTSFILHSLCAVILFANVSAVALAQEPTVDSSVGEPVRLEPGPERAIDAADASGSCSGGDYQSSNTEYEARVVHGVNQIRLEHGLMPLKRVPQLDAASRFHATDMSVDNYFSHTSYDRINGVLVEGCAWSQRVQSYYPNWGSLAENIAAGYRDPEAVINAWMQSEGHRANILSNSNWEIGVGYFRGSGQYTHYWVQDFGRRTHFYPIVLEGEAPTTTTGLVTVHIYGTWDQVRLRTDDQHWSDWMPFQKAIPWQIVGDVGERTVYAEMRNSSQAAASSDSIYLTSNTRNLSLADLPDRLSFVYNSKERRLAPDAHVIKPLLTAPSGYRWQAEVAGPWLRLSQATGQEGDPVEVRPVVSSASGIRPESATVTFTLVDAHGAVVDSHTIAVSLQILDGSARALYLPAVKH